MDANQTERNKYQQLKLKIRTIKEDLKFLKKCEQHKIIPNFINQNLRCTIKNNRTEKLLFKAKKMWLKIEKSHLYSKLENIEPEHYSFHLRLTRNLQSEELRAEWNSFDQHVETVNLFKINKKDCNY
jgi:hypothetical protein